MTTTIARIPGTAPIKVEYGQLVVDQVVLLTYNGFKVSRSTRRPVNLEQATDRSSDNAWIGDDD